MSITRAKPLTTFIN